MKKMTDKQRLDWLTRRKRNVWQQEYHWCCYNPSKAGSEQATGKTPRLAIDAAIKAERRDGK